jgi:hypothetical protein
MGFEVSCKVVQSQFSLSRATAYMRVQGFGCKVSGGCSLVCNEMYRYPTNNRDRQVPVRPLEGDSLPIGFGLICTVLPFDRLTV